MIHELFKVLQVVPPLKEEGISYEAEPRGDLQFFPLCFFQHGLKLLFGHIAVTLDLIGVRVQVNIFLHEEDVVNLMLTPYAIRWGFVVDPGKVSHLLWRYLDCKDIIHEQLKSRRPRQNSHFFIFFIKFQPHNRDFTCMGLLILPVLNCDFSHVKP